MPDETEYTRLPAHLPPGPMEKVLRALGDNQPRLTDEVFFARAGISAGNYFTALSSVKALGLVNDNNEIINPDLIARLGQQNERTYAIREIVNAAYAELVNRPDLNTLTLDDVEQYFEDQGVKEWARGRVARLFVWLAGEAGYTLADRIQPVFRAPRTSAKESGVDQMQQAVLPEPDPLVENITQETHSVEYRARGMTVRVDLDLKELGGWNEVRISKFFAGIAQSIAAQLFDMNETS